MVPPVMATLIPCESQRRRGELPGGTQVEVMRLMWCCHSDVEKAGLERLVLASRATLLADVSSLPTRL